MVIGFIYLFYKNYNAICVIDSTSLLMKKIIKTRKTVNYYVYYNIIMTIILSIIINFMMFSDAELLVEVFNPKHLEIDEVRDFVVERTCRDCKDNHHTTCNCTFELIEKYFQELKDENS